LRLANSNGINDCRMQCLSGL